MRREAQFAPLLPILADLAGVGLYLLLAPFLLRQFARLGFNNSLWLAAFYILFCFSVHYLRKSRPGQESTQPRLLENRKLMVTLAVVMALFVATATAYVTGFLDSVVNLNRTILDEPAAAIYLLLSPATWFGLALIYVLVLSPPAGSSENETSPAGPTTLSTLLALVGVNLMAVVSAVVFAALFARFPAAGSLPAGILIFLLFLLLFLPPRLIYAASTGRPASILTFLFLLSFLVATAIPAL
jgi:hypothetical protein